MNDEKIGQEIVDLFELKPTQPLKGDLESKYITAWGSKTVVGIGRCVSRIVEEAGE